MHPCSKTDAFCDCTWLRTMAESPDHPIEFDAETHEFRFVYPAAHGKGSLVIRHCPWCGGKTPESLRHSRFMRISEGERQRLLRLFKGLKCLEDMLSAFGPPDEDRAQGLIAETPEKGGHPSEIQAYRLLVYHGLSDTATVKVQVYPNDRVGFMLSGKPIPKSDE